MLYRLIKILMTVALRFFYRRIYVTGIETIPSTGPVILLANHPSALMDAVIIGLLVKRPVHFFTRGDVFVSRLINYLFAKLKMIPIHNHEGGRKTMGQNEESFLKAEKILAEGGIILFFPEGNSKIDRKLMPLRKGVFRMAFQAASKNNFEYNLPFIPVGINYEHPCDSNKDIMVHFGKPFFLNQYKAEYNFNPAGTLLKMSKDGFAELEKKVLHINDPANFSIANKCLIVYNSDYSFYTKSWQQATIKKFEGEKNICNKINKMTGDEIQSLQSSGEKYFNQLKKYGLKDETISPVFSFSGFKKWLLIRNAPFFIIGYLLNALPLLIGKKIADRTVTRIDYYSWVKVSCTTFLYLLWLIILFVGFLLIGWKYAMAVVLVTVVTGIGMYYYELYWKEYVQYKRLKKTDRNIIDQLRLLRVELNI